ncbi:MAG: class I SAM-dependent methyltransferase [Terriglobia bacterium]|jgi:SAM-dependent methyltransferase
MANTSQTERIQPDRPTRALSALDLRRVLNQSWAYLSLMRLIGGDSCTRRLAAEVLRAQPGQRVLDVGCGPGRLLAFLPDVSYVGIDASASYLATARARFPQSRFEQLDLEGDCSTFPDRDFDLIVAIGILHHLPDAAAARLFAFSHERLRVGGRLVTLDGVYWRGQHPAARLLISLDRGRFVRSASGYGSLARSAFTNVETTRYEDLLRVPYSHICLECRK